MDILNTPPNSSSAPQTKPNILFVDDELNVLDSCRLLFRSKRRDWNILCASNGLDALSCIAKHNINVIVCDLCMPFIDGIQLLTEVVRKSPSTTRIILSGHVDNSVATKALNVAHQVLRKPCPPDRLIETIATSVRLHNVVKSDYLKRIVAKIMTLPVLPPVYKIIEAELQRENASLKKIAFFIAKDIGMTAAIMRLVNSSFFGLRQHVSNVYQAITLLGVNTIKSIILSVHLFKTLKPCHIPDFSIQLLWEHSVRVSFYAKALGELNGFDKESCDILYISGMLHDIGKLVLASIMPRGYEKVIRSMNNKEFDNIHDAEMNVFFTTHAEVGSYLMSLWGFGNDIVESIYSHHKMPQGEGLTLHSTVATADHLDHEWIRLHDKECAIKDVDAFIAQREYIDKLKQWQHEGMHFSK